MSKSVYQGHISQTIAQHSYCGTVDNDVLFVAPIDLEPDDIVMIDPGSGQPLAVYRDKRKIWEFEDEYLSGSINFTATVDCL